MSENIKTTKVWSKGLHYYRRFKSELIPLLIVLIALILYNYFWDWIVGSKIIAFNSPFAASVWDLGAFYNRLWAALHYLNFRNIILNITETPVIYLLAPLYYAKNLFLLVYLQTFWISVSALPLYFIARKELKSQLVSLLISLSFLIYFGIAGINWYDVHFQTLFIPLFFLSYAFFIFEKPKLAFVFFFLSGSVHFLFFIFPLGFYIITLLYNWRSERRLVRFNKMTFFATIFFFVFLSISVAYKLHLSSIMGVVSTAHVGSLSFFSILVQDLDNKIETVLILFAPFLMIPIFSKKWILFTLPFLILVFFSGSYIFLYPYMLALPPQDFIVPFLFLGLIDVVSQLNITTQKRNNSRKIVSPIDEAARSRIKIIASIFVIFLMFAIVYEPYGPMNRYSVVDFQLSKEMDYNVTMYNGYNDLINLLPTNNPLVLYQNNMPQVLVRDPIALSGYIFGYSNNFTYPIGGIYEKGFWTPNIQYVLADPYDSYFLSGGSGNFSLSMYQTLDHFISERGYGIEGEFNGLILMKANYTGNPIVYAPMVMSFNTSKLDVTDWNYIDNATGVIESSNLTHGNELWYGPGTMLQPGKYNLRLEVKVSNISVSNKFVLRFSYYSNIYGATPVDISLINITGNNISAANRWTNISVNITATNFFERVEFAGQQFNWNGTFAIKEIKVSETAPL